MGGFPFRAATGRLVALARSTPCACASFGAPPDVSRIATGTAGGGPSGCLRCTADELTRHLHLVRLPLLTAPAPRPAPPLLAHIAGPVIACLDSGDRPSRAAVIAQRQACADCGAELERADPRTGWFFPEGTALYALPGRRTIGPDIALRLLGRTAVGCQVVPASSVSPVTVISFGSMRFVALLRVSTRGQARDGYGLEAQEADIRAWARRHRHRISFVVKETVPGDTVPNKRPALAEALQLLAAGKVDGVIVARLDRLARDLVLQEQLIAEVDTMGGVLRSAAPTEDDHLLDNDPQRVLVRQMLGAIAQYDRAMIRLRLSNGLRLKAASGGYVGGAPPYGWAARGTKLVPVHAEQQVRQRVKEWHRQGWSLRKIADRLNSEGITTKKGHQWQANSVSRLLANTRRAIPLGPQPPGPVQEQKAG